MGEILRLIQEGGFLMAPILGVSVWMWATVLHKGMELRSMGKYLRELISGEMELLGGGRRPMEVALRIAELRLEEGLPELRALIAIAPLLGLLGTVVGMDKAFWVIAHYGTGSPKALAKGISEALITTVSGLMVAIPGLLAYGVLARRVKEAKVRAKELVRGEGS